jgi:hypothetical protein
MAKLDSEITNWENRIKDQGRITSTKKDGPPQRRSGPNNRRRKRRTKDGCNVIHTVTQDSELVKPVLIHAPNRGATIDSTEQIAGLIRPKIDRSLFVNPTGAKHRIKEPKKVCAASKVQKYIDIWNASFFPKLREFRSKKDEKADKQTRIYQTTVRLLRKLIKGTLYNGSESTVRFPSNFQRGSLRVPLERFQYLVSNLERKAFNSDYKPRNKTYLAKTTLTLFLIGNGNYGSVPSLLLDRALTPAIPNTHTKPKDPKLAEVFREVFLFKTDRSEDTLTFAERNHLVGASNKYLDFFAHFQEPFEVYGYKDPIDFLDDYYWKAISDNWKGRKIRKISLGFLNSGMLIDRVLVPYFLKIGMLKEFDFIDKSVFKK